MSVGVDLAFWRGKRVLITGHTGFKGAWTWLWLSSMGAKVFGYARPPVPGPCLYEMAQLGGCDNSLIGDLSDQERLRQCVAHARPEIVIHLASQAFVRRAYREPVETFRTNVEGTVHLMEALRNQSDLRLVLVVTTDKVYQNDGQARAFKETDALGGDEPYSASKVGQEMVAQAYARSYFEKAGVRVATARGGNVIGGGDFGEDRLIPDIVRAVEGRRNVAIRNPGSSRPWQHVFDCLAGYLTYIQALSKDSSLSRSVNIGPSAAGVVTVADVVDLMCRSLGRPEAWFVDQAEGPKEATTLALDVGFAKQAIGWTDRLSPEVAIIATAEWYQRYMSGDDMRLVSSEALDWYLGVGSADAGFAGSSALLWKAPRPKDFRKL